MSDLMIPGDDFWRVLLDHGTLDESLVGEFKQALSANPWRSLGQILIHEGFLTVKQVAGLVGMQVDEPRVRLGDLAIREEYCTVQQIRAALAIQGKTAPGPVELMLRDHRVSDDSLVNALVGYLHHLEGRVHILRSALADKQDTECDSVS